MAEERKIPLLKATDVEVKVKQCSEKGAVALLYKTARIDMAILDKVYGAENWECDYKEIKGNLYCGIGVRTAADQPFVWKWDCGIESREDDEGNQKKGEASDAFKRAGFKWGIGRELYTAPFIFLAVPTKQKAGGKWELTDRFARFDCAVLKYDDEGNITTVVIVDKNGEVVYPRGVYNVEETDENEKQDRKPVATDKKPPVKPTNGTGKQKPTTEPTPTTGANKSKYSQVCEAIDGTDITLDRVMSYCEKAFGITRINNLTDKQFSDLMDKIKDER